MVVSVVSSTKRSLISMTNNDRLSGFRLGLRHMDSKNGVHRSSAGQLNLSRWSTTLSQANNNKSMVNESVMRYAQTLFSLQIQKDPLNLFSQSRLACMV